MDTLLTFPDRSGMALSIRAKLMVFHDPRASELLQQVERIARSDATTLIIGATGTGKELIARQIHTQSGRRGPFVAVNCGALNESLIDAELFGHEAGAFTGATAARSGWFEAANGGTLFLDEIGDLSLALQVKLLRVLQERQVVRLGARKPIALDLRLVAATNVDLQKAILAGRFRSDLYYRLNVATVRLPPLRERTGDILPLARHFIGLYSDKLKRENVTLSPEAQRALLAYQWSGNIRELENVIHCALIVRLDDVIRADDLQLRGVANRALEPARAAAPAAAVPQPCTAESLQLRLVALITTSIESELPDLLDTTEEALVRTAYESCNRNQVQTAKVLGISRSILRTHLKRFGLGGKNQAGAPSQPAGLGDHDELLQHRAGEYR